MKKKKLQYVEDIFSRSPAVAFVWKNAEGWPVEYVSSNVHSVFGWSKDDFLSGRLSYSQVVHPDDLPRISDEVQRYSADKTAERIIHEPYRIVARDGSVKWVEDLTTILRDEDGGVAAYEGIILDVTNRKVMEEKLHLIQLSVDQAAIGISWINREGRIVYANKTEYRRLGYTLEEFLNMYSYDVDPTLTPERWPAAWERGKKRGARTFETLHRTKGGKTIPVEVSANYIEYNGREYSFAFSRDITERKLAEAEQERLRAQLESAVEIASLGPWEHDFIKDVFIVNDQFYRVYHTTAEQVGGYTMSSDDHIRQFVHPDDVPLVKEEMRKIMARADSLSGHQFEHRFFYPDGKVGYATIRISFVKDTSGKVIKAYGVSQDITERKLEERTRLANLKYFESMEKVNRAIQGGVNDLDRIMGDVLNICLSVFECDRAFLLYPCDPEAPFWSVPMEQMRPECPGFGSMAKPMSMDDQLAMVLRTALSAAGPFSFDPASVHPPEDEFWERHGFRSQLAIALHPKVGEPWLFGLHQCAYNRIWTSEEKELFEKIAQRLSDSLTSLLMYRDLRKNEEFLSNIVENIPDTILVKDADELRFLSINQAGVELLGFSKEELIGKNSYDLVPKEQAKLYETSDREVLDKAVPVDIPEETIRNKKGEPRIIHTKKIPLLDDAGKPQHLLTISSDITDYKKLQAQLNQAQKMEALGAMSGGIAHDFNNILQPMLGYCEFLKEDLPADSPLQTYVDGILKSGLRAKDLVNQILAFSRQSDRRMIAVELPVILKEAVKLCRSTIPSNIKITRKIQKDCSPVMADPTQLHQIIMNLMVNAYHAMEYTGGEISVRLIKTQLEKDDLKGIPLQPGKYARLSISDTGCGMEPAVLEKIFEPYFTTKAQGKGTGLGLAIAYGIVKEHGGHISAYSEVGRGSTFNIYLPLVEGVFDTLQAERVDLPRSTGHEHILLVDDEEVIIQLESKMLERVGYRVTSCSNGAEALAVFGKNPNAFDLVLTDMNMPNMTGDQLAREMIAIRQDIPIIICTGFSEKIGWDEAKAIGVKGFLLKPVSVLDIAQKVRKALDGE